MSTTCYSDNKSERNLVSPPEHVYGMHLCCPGASRQHVPAVQLERRSGSCPSSEDHRAEPPCPPGAICSRRPCFATQKFESPSSVVDTPPAQRAQHGLDRTSSLKDSRRGDRSPGARRRPCGPNRRRRGEEQDRVSAAARIHGARGESSFHSQLFNTVLELTTVVPRGRAGRTEQKGQAARRVCRHLSPAFSLFLYRRGTARAGRYPRLPPAAQGCKRRCRPRYVARSLQAHRNA